MKRSLILCLLLVFIAVASNGVCATYDNLVENGGFESFDGSGPGSWSVYKKIPGWTATSGSGIEVEKSGVVVASKSGDYHVELDSHNNSSMTQSVTLGEGDYELSFWYQPRTPTVGDNTIVYSVAGLFTDSMLDIRNSQTGWEKVTQAFSVETAKNYDLTFAAGGLSNSLGGFIDDVSLTAVRSSNPTATPIPSSLGLLLSGVAGFAVLRRKKVMN